MAVVLEALASYLQNMLTEMAVEEVRMLLGVPDEMTKMNAKLRDLKKFLLDADRRNITDESVQGWVKELKRTMYYASDILDLCQLKAMKRGPSRDMGCFNPLLFCMRNPLHAHDIGTHLRKLNQKLDDIEKRSKTFNFIDLSPCQDHGRKNESSRPASRETTPDFDKLDLVGKKIEDDTRNFVDLLTRKEKTIDKQNSILVFAIVGTGGIGKTTLAQKIFDNERIKKEFAKKIWLSVNQNYSETELLKRTIEVGGGHQTSGNTNAMLVKSLKETLNGCKILLVMDDVWNHLAWETVLKTPLREVLAQGSRVLITTRDYNVARGMMAEEPYHHVDKLDLEDAWSLLKKQVVKNNEAQVDMLKDIGMKILEKYDGLPLAVKVMGGLLRKKKARQSDWQNVLNDSTACLVSKMPEELNYAIYLSYQDMDPSLKSCFLHFSLLPKSKEFSVDDIIGMWISDRFVHGGSRDLEELARDYYDELILRNVIEPDMRCVDQGVCNMHDIVRLFAQYVARDEALAAHGSQTDIIVDNLNSQKFTRLSLETKGSESNALDWTYLQTQSSLRTLISVGPIKIKSGDSLVGFPSLRTLHVQDTNNFDALSESLVQLKHLRYLSIHNTNTTLLPENVGNINFLQYISLADCDSLLKLPHSIRQLRNLRFLNINGARIKNVPKGFGGLTNLRKLFGFPTQIDGDWCSLEELGPLSKLIALSIGVENLSDSTFARRARLLEKDCLTSLRLECTNRRHGKNDQLSTNDENIFEREQQQIKAVFDELYRPPCIENLLICGYFGQRFPSWMLSATTMAFRCLRILMMEDMPCCTELPDSLYQIPCLEFLQIKLAPAIKHVGPDFLQPRHHNDPSAPENLGSPFEVEVNQCAILEKISNLRKTQELTIIGCPKLTVLKDMHALQRLILVDYDMKTLPEYLQDVNPRHLQVECDVTLLTLMAAGKSSPEWVKFSHIQQVKAYADDDENNIERKWYVWYRRDPFSFDTNIGRSTILKARRERTQDIWLAYEKTCPTEDWAVRRADAENRQPFCHRFRHNAYRHLVLWLHGACLHCYEALRIAH